MKNKNRFVVHRQFPVIVCVVVVIACVLALTGCSQKSQGAQSPETASTSGRDEDSVAGFWGWENGDSYFHIALEQQDNQVIGFHTARTKDKPEIDEILVNTPSIIGTVKGKTIQGTIYSAMLNKEIFYKIELVNKNSLRWKVTSKEKESYFPIKLTLQRLANKI